MTSTTARKPRKDHKVSRGVEPIGCAILSSRTTGNGVLTHTSGCDPNLCDAVVARQLTRVRRRVRRSQT